MQTPVRVLTRTSGTTLSPVRQTTRQQSRTVRPALVVERMVPRSPDRLPASDSATAAAIQPGEILAFSIVEFCRLHCISRAHFYNLSKNGEAPAMMRVGRRALISVEAAAEWRSRMEALAHSGSTSTG